MMIRAYAKINWALNILGTRPDGYHEMDMLMQRISLCDELHIEPADELSLTVEQEPAGRCYAPVSATGDNLVLRAANALNQHGGARIRLVKRIPSRAGLGGGSADAAATLLALNALWGLGLSQEELHAIALQLGADVPFCLLGQPARARGLGEVLTPIPAKAGVPLVILHPGGLSTPEMFRAWDAEAIHAPPADIEACARALAEGDLRQLRQCAGNALTDCAVRALPAVGRSIERLYKCGALFAAMSGSGAAVFGAFSSADAAKAAHARLGKGAILAETC